MDQASEGSISEGSWGRWPESSIWLDWPDWACNFPFVKQWAVQDAKNQLSQVIQLACTVGPQTITRHGRPMAVVVAADEFKKLRSPKETPLEFFSRFKGAGLDLRRNKDRPRKVTL